MDDYKELEKLIDTLMDADVLEMPSVDFTQQVLEKTIFIKSKQTVYKPLLPKWMLFLVAILVVGFLVYGVKLYVITEPTITYFKGFDKVGIWSSKLFSLFNLSSTVTYSVIISGLLISFHSLLLKRYFEKRLD